MRGIGVREAFFSFPTQAAPFRTGMKDLEFWQLFFFLCTLRDLKKKYKKQNFPLENWTRSFYLLSNHFGISWESCLGRTSILKSAFPRTSIISISCSKSSPGLSRLTESETTVTDNSQGAACTVYLKSSSLQYWFLILAAH